MPSPQQPLRPGQGPVPRQPVRTAAPVPQARPAAAPRAAGAPPIIVTQPRAQPAALPAQPSAGPLSITPTVQHIMSRNGWEMKTGVQLQASTDVAILKPAAGSEIILGAGYAITVERAAKTYALHTIGAVAKEVAPTVSRQLIDHVFDKSIAPLLFDVASAKSALLGCVVKDPAEQQPAHAISYGMDPKKYVTNLSDISGGNHDFDLLVRTHGFENLGIALTESQQAFYDTCRCNDLARAVEWATYVARFDKGVTPGGESALKYGELNCRDEGLRFFKEELNAAPATLPHSAEDFLRAFAKHFPTFEAELLVAVSK